MRCQVVQVTFIEMDDRDFVLQKNISRVLKQTEVSVWESGHNLIFYEQCK